MKVDHTWLLLLTMIVIVLWAKIVVLSKEVEVLKNWCNTLMDMIKEFSDKKTTESDGEVDDESFDE